MKSRITETRAKLSSLVLLAAVFIVAAPVVLADAATTHDLTNPLREIIRPVFDPKPLGYPQLTAVPPGSEPAPPVLEPPTGDDPAQSIAPGTPDPSMPGLAPQNGNEPSFRTPYALPTPVAEPTRDFPAPRAHKPVKFKAPGRPVTPDPQFQPIDPGNPVPIPYPVSKRLPSPTPSGAFIDIPYGGPFTPNWDISRLAAGPNSLAPWPVQVVPTVTDQGFANSVNSRRYRFVGKAAFKR